MQIWRAVIKRVHLQKNYINILLNFTSLQNLMHWVVIGLQLDLFSQDAVVVTDRRFMHGLILK